MNSDIRKLLNNVKAGVISIDDAVLELKKAPYEELGYAKIDMHRNIRQGFAEVIYGASKTPEQILGIVTKMLEDGQKNILITRTPELNLISYKRIISHSREECTYFCNILFIIFNFP